VMGTPLSSIAARLFHSDLAEMLAVRDRKLFDWEKIDPAVKRAAEAAWSMSDDAAQNTYFAGTERNRSSSATAKA
jgi:hypothetical protein